VSRGKILVIRGGAIGDFILTLPALAALRKQFPQTRIEVLGYTHIASLATLAGYANDVKSIEAGALAGFFARRGTLDDTLGEYFAAFNIIVSYLYDPDRIFQDNIARISKAQFIAGPHRPDEREPLHATEVFLKPLERLAIFEADSTPCIELPQQDSGSTLAVHPGSGSEKKNWPEARWVELLTHIVNETNWRVLLVGGEAEHDRVQRLSSLIPIQRLTVAMNQPLPELARRLASCCAFVGHDSGITHLAAAVGARGLALWGESNELIWRPRSDKFAVLKAPTALADLRAEAVFSQVSPLMDK
jgi:heptosyltransferase III